MKKGNKKEIERLYDEMVNLKKNRILYPRKNDFDRQKAIIRIQNRIMELNKQ